MSQKTDERFMGRALALARKGMGRTSPNPMVGCVIVRDGVIVGEGWHRRAGGPHAEVEALRMAGGNARGGDLFVTLEPCSHHGRTPPCCEAIVEAGIRRVVAAVIDPNPLVSGRGVAYLREHGVETVVGVMEEEARFLNWVFFRRMTSGLPQVILKSAATLDGFVAASTGDSRWITGEAARLRAHRLRGRSDAVMVGVGTVIADDPLLTCRLPRGRNPMRVVVDSNLRTPVDSQLVRTASMIPTLVAAATPDPERLEALQDAGMEVGLFPGPGGKVDLRALLIHLGGRDVASVLVEGGPRLAGALLAERLVDRIAFFYAPKILGKTGIPMLAGPPSNRIDEALRVEGLSVTRVGPDLLLEGKVVYECSPG